MSDLLDIETSYSELRAQMHGNFVASRQPGEYDFWVKANIPIAGSIAVLDMQPALGEDAHHIARFAFADDSAALAFYIRNSEYLIRMEGMS